MYQNGFNQSTYSGFNPYYNTGPVTQQPGMYLRRQPTMKRPYDFQWHEKTSPNGEFKYGLCQCCSGPSGCIAIMAIVMCFIPWPGWFLTAQINGEVADVVGK
jgi:hypothetical protein